MINHVTEDRLYAKLLREFVANKHSFLRAYCQYSETLFEKEVERDRELAEMHGGMEFHPDDPDYDPESPVAFFSQAAEFRKTLRRSNFITVYSLWESQYKYYAEWMLIADKRRRDPASVPRLRDIKGESVSDRYRTILVQHIGLSDDQALWTVLADLAVVRDQIVHGVGELSPVEIDLTTSERDEHVIPKHDRLIEVLNKYEDKGLSMDKPGEFLIDAPLIEYLIDTTEKYMNDVITAHVEHLKEPTAVS